MKHPGSPILYRTDVPIWEGGGTFRARFGVERNGETLLAEDSYSEGSQLTDGYPEFNYGILRKLGWDADLRPEELATIQRVGGDKVDAVSWATDLSGGIQRVCMDHGVMHYGNGKARVVAWNLPDPVPVHREPIYTSRPDLVEKYPTRPDERQFRIPNIGYSVQQAAIERNVAGNFPILLTSGRLVEYEGGGEETRSNRWLAELQQEMFVEINPADATARGVEDGQYVWVYGTENDAKTRVKALVTERVAPGVAFMPFHFSGHYQGEDWREHYPAGTDPIVLGESVNTITTYGFDPVTGMQETKVVLCQIAAA
ncbi:MAG: formate dehydrogenase subunit alpha, partial [Aurantimonas coralicida]|nr:formate dehydrogenase subunit alpha [Aurantimonas coralicida]